MPHELNTAVTPAYALVAVRRIRPYSPGEVIVPAQGPDATGTAAFNTVDFVAAYHWYIVGVGIDFPPYNVVIRVVASPVTVFDYLALLRAVRTDLRSEASGQR